MINRVDQILPTISPYDAVGNETLVIHDTLKKMGYESKIYAENIHPSLKNVVRNYKDYKNTDENSILIYHHSIGSTIADFVFSNHTKTIMIYHNITPPEFFEGINNSIANLLLLGRNQLNLLQSKIKLAFGDSEYNRLELEKKGYEKTAVLPILLDTRKYLMTPDPDLISKFGDFTNILYVGRLVPNKRVHELIKAFTYYHLNINRKSNLFIIGQSAGVADEYFNSLQVMVNETRLSNIHFITDANDEKLISFYNLASIFVTLSLHEGFCVPLIESMFFKVPIIAYNSTAIPYTLEGSGILVKDETYEEIGELIDVIVNNTEIRNKIIEKQTKRFNEIYYKDNKSMISDLLNLIK